MTPCLTVPVGFTISTEYLVGCTPVSGRNKIRLGAGQNPIVLVGCTSVFQWGGINFFENSLGMSNSHAKCTGVEKISKNFTGAIPFYPCLMLQAVSFYIFNPVNEKIW